jgi:predicted phage baseplate assembly protein
MPLPLPKLDNRSFDELLAEGRALTPRYAPRWTDHNVHDPGITLLELFAWLSEMTFYRLDRVTEASYRAFLRMVGVRVHPARSAETVLVFRREGDDEMISLPRGLQVGGDEAAPVFQTTRRLDVVPARLATILCGREGALEDRTADNVALRRYQPFGSQPGVGSALYLGFDQPLPANPAQVSLHVWTGATAASRETRRQLILERRAALRDARLSSPQGTAAPELPRWWEHYSAQLAWEYYAEGDTWATLEAVADRTRALTLDGSVRFNLPAHPAPAKWANDQYFIRCRLTGGAYEAPPEIEGVAVNAVRARHAADIETEEFLGTSDGRAGQLFQLRHSPVVPSSTKLRVLLPNGAEDAGWREVSFWDSVTPHERAYQLSAESGRIVFGDGRAGRVPEAGAQLHVRYGIGGGAAGNVAAGRLERPLPGGHNAALVPAWETLRPSLRVRQPFDATGGAGAESLAHAKGRAVAALNRPERAVTLKDFEALTLSTPGVPIARARALADYHPSLPCFPVPGSVTVVVLPQARGAQPQPGAEMIEAVRRHLDRRRTLATEVHVVAPEYTRVAVHARLNVEAHTDAAKLTAQARQALDDFFDPLRGGPDGAGWPVGRDVFRSEVLALLGDLPGVVYVDAFGLRAGDETEPRCGNLPVCRNSLIASGNHQISVIERSTTR